MGRKKKPTKLKLLEGTNRKDRENPNEPQYEPALPEPPSFLSKDALEHWHELGAVLVEKGLLSTVNKGSFVMLCESWGEFVEAKRKLEGKDAITETTNKNAVQDLWVGVANRARESYMKRIVEFGGTPASAMKVSAKTKKKKDEWSQFG